MVLTVRHGSRQPLNQPMPSLKNSVQDRDLLWFKKAPTLDRLQE